MTRASQNTWTHRIEEEEASPDSHTELVRYSLTLRSIGQHYANSTVVLGDSNTKYIKFGESKGTFGYKMPGERIETFHIGAINPSACIGYQNIIINVGINDLRESSPGRKSDDPPPDDIEAHFIRLTKVLEIIQTYCPSSRIILAPLLPTKSSLYNRRAMHMNDMLKKYVQSVNTGIRFLDYSCFLDSRTGLLGNQFGSYLNPSDCLHLGKLGIRKLAQIFIEAVMRPKADVRLYSSMLSNDFVPRIGT